MKMLAREKNEGPEISAVAALRARFNMMVAFAATDIVLSHPNERPVVFSKFLRIAWKSYLLNNFAAVVALITSLQTPMVSAAMRRLWSRVGMWEMRVFEDLKEFSSPRGNFKFIREAIAAMVDRREDPPNGPPSAHSSVSSRSRMPVDKAVAPASCIPFIGVYLSDLHRYRKLPEYIDPTSPSSRVLEGPNGQLSSPRHPEVFSTLAPLPPSVQLEPMANVQKQRLTAGTVKEIVAGQHLASKISFDLDRKLYQKCLRLKALPPDKLVDVAKTYGGEA
ncbi:hypothetical protein FRC01_011826 [Tulasnella sp. 417]|nr:hypothetical protein FRC01_011826 [Tulasnella sp. 417]